MEHPSKLTGLAEGVHATGAVDPIGRAGAFGRIPQVEVGHQQLK